MEWVPETAALLARRPDRAAAWAAASRGAWEVEGGLGRWGRGGSVGAGGRRGGAAPRRSARSPRIGCSAAWPRPPNPPVGPNRNGSLSRAGVGLYVKRIATRIMAWPEAPHRMAQTACLRHLAALAG